VDNLLGRDFRANPRYELVLFDRLPVAERQRASGLLADPGFYGILRPQGGSSLGLKSVDRDTALLFLTLREPGPLPAYVGALLGEELERTVAQLVADGVFEVEVDSGSGVFVSGAAAFDALGDRGSVGDREEAGGHLHGLSLAALRYAEGLAVDDPTLLTLRLYAYNRRPLTPAWQRLLPDAPAVERFLGIGPGGASRRMLEQHWSRRPGFAGWMSWRRRGPAAGGGSPGRGGRGTARGQATYKLYVSPAPEVLPTAFGEILAALVTARVPQVKIGSDARGMLRPDKIVAHFPDFEALAAAAARLSERLAGIAVQGVPFTAEIGGDGLVSWGVDPPHPAGSPASGRESWRTWLCRRLALALLAARGSSPEPWRFALERLRLEGVDTTTWAPGARVFRPEHGE
jgi:hypothetical protein